MTRSQQENRGLARTQRDQLTPFPPPFDLLANPFGTMRRMHEDMDRMFAQSFGGMGGGLMSGGSSSTAGGLTAWSPAIEVKEQDN